MGTIKLKRGNNTGLAALTLEAGEPAFSLDTGKLYVGDGTNKILINPDAVSNAATATKLATARTITVSGDVDGSATFDGSANVNIAVVLDASGAAAGTYTKLTIDAKGRVTSGVNLAATDVPTLTLAKISDAGTAASKNTGTASGNIPILDGSGKIDSTLLPALAITDTFVVATQVAMLALSTAEVGDLAIRTDLNKSFILKTTGPSVLANWQEILTPTAAVASVAGKTGAVTLISSDVGLGSVDNTADAAKPVSTAQATAIGLKANLASPSLTGVPLAPSAAIGTNTTQIATTAFVKSQGYITSSSDIDGGTF